MFQTGQRLVNVVTEDRFNAFVLHLGAAIFAVLFVAGLATR